MIVRNGMPYVVQAVESVFQQTYQNLELVVQDCRSSDGTFEALEQLKERSPFPMVVVSEQDEGIADGYNRAVQRAQGSYVAVMEADNFFLPGHVETTLAFLLKNRGIAVVTPSHRMVDAQGEPLHDWQAPDLDFFGILCQERVFPSGSTLKNRDLLGDDVYYWVTPQASHVCDYEYWLRLALKGFRGKALPDVTYATRLSAASGTCDVSRYEAFCREKVYTLEAVGQRFPASQFVDFTMQLGRAGIYMWAAESVWSLGGTYAEAMAFVARARTEYPAYARIAKFADDLGYEIGRDVQADLTTDSANLPEMRRQLAY